MNVRLNALLLTGLLCTGAAQADTLADTESDCRIEENELKCRVLSDVKPAASRNYPAGRTVRISIPNRNDVWDPPISIYLFPDQTNRRVTVFSETGRDITAQCPLDIRLTHWVGERPTYNHTWAGAKSTAYMDAAVFNSNIYSTRLWWAGEMASTGNIAFCPAGELTVRLTFTPALTHQTVWNNVTGHLPPVQADFGVLNFRHVSLSVPPAVGLTLSGRGAAGAGMITLRRWGDVSMEVTRADDHGEPSLDSPSGSTTVPLEVTLDTLSGRLNVAKGSTDNVIRWDGRAGENGYRLNITTKGDVKKQLTEEPGIWRSTLRVTVNAL